MTPGVISFPTNTPPAETPCILRMPLKYNFDDGPALRVYENYIVLAKKIKRNVCTVGHAGTGTPEGTVQMFERLEKT